MLFPCRCMGGRELSLSDHSWPGNIPVCESQDTPNGVLHRDSHYWRKFIGGVHKIQILIREKLEDFLRNFWPSSVMSVCPVREKTRGNRISDQENKKTIGKNAATAAGRRFSSFFYFFLLFFVCYCSPIFCVKTLFFTPRPVQEIAGLIQGL